MFAENKTILSISPRAESFLCAIEKKEADRILFHSSFVMLVARSNAKKDLHVFYSYKSILNRFHFKSTTLYN